MKQYFTTTLSLTLGLALVAGAALAESHMTKAQEDSIKARKAQMQVIAYSTGILGGMAKGETDYDATLATSAATNLHAAASFDRASLWIAGTEQGVAEGSRAKAEIWTDIPGFDEKFMGLEDAAAAMTVAAGMDLEALRGAMGDIGKACSACHDDYRGPKN